MSRINPTPAVRSFDEGRLMQVLIAPIVSEKATHVADKTNAITSFTPPMAWVLADDTTSGFWSAGIAE